MNEKYDTKLVSFKSHLERQQINENKLHII